jgi:TIR domain/Pentapeptide repeats (8 copies)
MKMRSTISALLSISLKWRQLLANATHLKILKEGINVWNDWRRRHLVIEPDLSNVDLSNVDLSSADLGPADLIDANLRGVKLHGTNLTGAKLCGAILTGADLRGANLSLADFSGVNLYGANLRDASLSGAVFNRAFIGETIFVNTNLSLVKGLEEVAHSRPSEISISTIYLSEGKIPNVFLRGCGVPEAFIVQIPALVAAIKPIQFYSCFISYSRKDEEFARRLHGRMRQSGLRVWFAPEDIKGGEKLYEQIDHAIQVHDRLLLVLSENSLRSNWVEREIRRARKVELKEGRRKLFPIRLTDFGTLQDWVCVDSTTGEDLADEVRDYFIPDFSNWKGHDDFEKGYTRLLDDLKAST